MKMRINRRRVRARGCDKVDDPFLGYPVQMHEQIAKRALLWACPRWGSYAGSVDALARIWAYSYQHPVLWMAGRHIVAHVDRSEHLATVKAVLGVLYMIPAARYEYGDVIEYYIATYCDFELYDMGADIAKEVLDSLPPSTWKGRADQ